MPARSWHIEYDPNRSARIALLHYADGEKRYIIAPEGIKQGDVIETGAQADIKPGNNLPLRNIPTGTVVHAIELRPLGGARSPARWCCRATRRAKDGAYAQLRMPSAKSATWMLAAAQPLVVSNSDRQHPALARQAALVWMGKRRCPW